MISLISSFSLKLYLNYYFVDVWSKHLWVFLESLLQSSKSSEMFGNFWKNVRGRLSGLQNNFEKSSESGRRSSENCQKRHHQYVYIIKRTLHVSWEVRWPHGWCARLWSERSGFEPWLGTLCCVLGQDTLLSRCLSPPRCINGYRRT